MPVGYDLMVETKLGRKEEEAFYLLNVSKEGKFLCREIFPSRPI